MEDRGWDASVGAGARAVPFGAAVLGEAGRTLMLWGRGPETAGEFRYGYLRPRLRVRTSGAISRAEASVQLFPVAFLGLESGAGGGYRLTSSLATVDCETSECGGGLATAFARANLTLGHAGAFLMGAASLERQLPFDASKGRSYVDDGSTLVGAPEGDTLRELSLHLGYRIGIGWAAGTMMTSGRMLASGSTNDMIGLFGRHQWGEGWTVTAGLGAYRSSTYDRGPTVFCVLTRILRPTLEIQ